MNGLEMQQARKSAGWTQVQLAQKLGVSQGYVSLMEANGRRVPDHLAQKLVELLGLSASRLPVTGQHEPIPPSRAAGTLGALGYSGFAHLSDRHPLNPAELLLRVLEYRAVEARLVEALPWVLVRFPDLDWEWLLLQAKQRDLQNRLGFVVTVARELAERRADHVTADTLRHWERVLEDSRLQKEDAFSGEALTEAERKWLKTNRSAEAAHWNLLSNVSADTLSHV
jgi:transcriptional regulator with XRE-family HTH domain